VLWEGPDAVEDVSKISASSLKGPPAIPKKPVVAAPGPEPEPHAASDSAEDPDSEDEYVADGLKGKGSAVGKVRSRSTLRVCSPAYPSSKRRRARRLSFSSESGSESSGAERSGRSRKPASPGASKGHLKRKAQKAHPPPPKRKKAADSDATEDPARAFCLGKLEGVFHDIFLRYPHVRTETTDGGPSVVEKKAEDLSEEEKAKVEEEAKQFATDLEQCVYDIYSEPDKQGRPSAGGKYKYVVFVFLPLLRIVLTFYRVAGIVSECCNLI
jgi:hypothetical protein